MTRKISIDPITRLEGHGKIEIFLSDDGAVENGVITAPAAGAEFPIWRVSWPSPSL